MRPRRRKADLIAVAALAPIAAIAATASPAAWIEAAAGAPLVLLLPGYALSAAFFPPATLGAGERLVQSFVLSVSASALGMLALQLLLDLHRSAWGALLLGVTLCAAAVAWRRRRALPIVAEGRTARRPRPRVVSGLACLAAIALAGASVAIASNGVREQQSGQVFASLWAVPAQADRGGPVTVGILNHGGPASYRMRVSASGEVVESFPIRLGDRRRWSTTLPPPIDSSTRSLVVELLHGGTVYRSVELNIVGES